MLQKRNREYIAVWGGRQPAKVGYGGDYVMIPPFDVVAVTGGRSIYRLPAARDEHGTPIPGTVVISDVMKMNDEGAEEYALDAYKWSLDIIRVNTSGKADEPRLVERGFQIVEGIAEVPAAREKARAQYFEQALEGANALLAKEYQRVEMYPKTHGGQPAPALTGSAARELAEAMEIKAEFKAQSAGGPQFSLDALREALGGPGAPATPTAAAAPQSLKAKVSAEADELADAILDAAEGATFFLKKEDYVAIAKRDAVGMLGIVERMDAAGVKVNALQAVA